MDLWAVGRAHAPQQSASIIAKLRAAGGGGRRKCWRGEIEAGPIEIDPGPVQGGMDVVKLMQLLYFEGQGGDGIGPKKGRAGSAVVRARYAAVYLVAGSRGGS